MRGGGSGLVESTWFEVLSEAASTLGMALFGVEKKVLGEVCEILDSKRKPIKQSERTLGNYPYYGANGIQDWVDSFIFEGTFILMGEDGSVINSNGTPILHWVENSKFWVNNHAHVLGKRKHIHLKYVFYSLQKTNISNLVKGVPPKLNQENMKSIQLLVPSPIIQSFVVKKLDVFSELATSLRSGLPREIELRRKQYEYYRERLLAFPQHL